MAASVAVTGTVHAGTAWTTRSLRATMTTPTSVAVPHTETSTANPTRAGQTVAPRWWTWCSTVTIASRPACTTAPEDEECPSCDPTAPSGLPTALSPPRPLAAPGRPSFTCRKSFPMARSPSRPTPVCRRRDSRLRRLRSRTIAVRTSHVRRKASRSVGQRRRPTTNRQRPHMPRVARSRLGVAGQGGEALGRGEIADVGIPDQVQTAHLILRVGNRITGVLDDGLRRPTSEGVHDHVVRLHARHSVA